MEQIEGLFVVIKEKAEPWDEVLITTPVDYQSAVECMHEWVKVYSFNNARVRIAKLSFLD